MTSSVPVLHLFMGSRVPSHTRHATCPCPAGEALLRAGLLYLPDLDIYLAKVGGRAVKGQCRGRLAGLPGCC